MTAANESQSHINGSLAGQLLTRTQRLAIERVARAKAALRRNLAAPPNLAELARIAGCSAPYLSRTFTRIEGVTISRSLLLARLDLAAEYLAAGRYNVSEASAAVGYRSLAHFSRTFTKEKGVHPSEWVDHLKGNPRE